MRALIAAAAGLAAALVLVLVVTAIGAPGGQTSPGR
nr:SPW_0924 family protein [Streptomyces sp. MST-110588]